MTGDPLPGQRSARQHGVDLALVNGALRLDEQVEWARLLRRKARLLVAFGACAHTGGVVATPRVSRTTLPC